MGFHRGNLVLVIHLTAEPKRSTRNVDLNEDITIKCSLYSLDSEAKFLLVHLERWCYSILFYAYQAS